MSFSSSKRQNAQRWTARFFLPPASVDRYANRDCLPCGYRNALPQAHDRFCQILIVSGLGPPPPIKTSSGFARELTVTRAREGDRSRRDGRCFPVNRTETNPNRIAVASVRFANDQTALTRTGIVFSFVLRNAIAPLRLIYACLRLFTPIYAIANRENALDPAVFIVLAFFRPISHCTPFVTRRRNSVLFVLRATISTGKRSDTTVGGTV